MICPKCRNTEFQVVDVIKGKQFKCKKCGYEGPMMEGLI